MPRRAKKSVEEQDDTHEPPQKPVKLTKSQAVYLHSQTTHETCSKKGLLASRQSGKTNKATGALAFTPVTADIPLADSTSQLQP